ncbi:hypothetical protein GUJ93_ZPchr0013g35003 [Zizania palustris]|uniref:Uncharacterized protein n=1 Tax=Zizania palustris TaxID=103762 RepID=A0A8J6C151_ZIZPA|nr:hypothetical protein GUJ93_ZPchr0013g35003 [Zizania palustris]
MTFGLDGGGRQGGSGLGAAAALAFHGDGEDVSSGVERWTMDSAAARARLLLRAVAWLYSLLTLVAWRPTRTATAAARTSTTTRPGIHVSGSIAYISACIFMAMLSESDTDDLFTDSTAVANSMTFFAFVAVGMPALISGYNLSMEALV